MSKKDDHSRSAVELAQIANAKPQGRRPEYFRDPMGEHTFSISMALMAELAVARERIDTLERLLVAKGVLQANEVENFVPDGPASEARQKSQVEHSLRVLRSMQQQVEGLEEQNPLSMDEMADKLAVTDPDE